MKGNEGQWDIYPYLKCHSFYCFSAMSDDHEDHDDHHDYEDYEDYPDDEFDPEYDDIPEYGFEEDESIEELLGKVQELRKGIENGQFHLRSELALALVRLAWRNSENNDHEDAIRCFDEAIVYCRELLDEGQIEFRYSLGKTMLHRALEFNNIEEAPVKRSPGVHIAELNRAIAYLEGIIGEGEANSRDDLAVAYMCAADHFGANLRVFNTALSYQNRAIEIWSELIEEGEFEHRLSLATAIRTKGDTLRELGDAAEAIKNYVGSEEIARELVEEGNERARTSVLKAIMKRAETLGVNARYEDAQNLYLEAVELCRILSEEDEPEVVNWLPFIHIDRARFYRSNAEFSDALGAFDEAIKEYGKIEKKLDGHPVFIGILKEKLAQIQMDRGCMLHVLDRFEEAKEAFGLSRELFNDPMVSSDTRYELALLELNRASLLCETGEFEGTLEIQVRAIEILESLDYEGHEAARFNAAKAYAQKGATLFALGRIADAELAHEKSVAAWNGIVDEGLLEHRETLAFSLISRSNFYRDISRFDQSIADVRKVLSIRRELHEEGEPGAHPRIPPCHLLIARTLEMQDKFPEALLEYEIAIEELHRIIEEGDNSVFTDLNWAVLRELDILLHFEESEKVELKCAVAVEFLQNADRVTGKGFQYEISLFTMYRGHAAAMGGNPDFALEFYKNAITGFESIAGYMETESSLEPLPGRDSDEDGRKRIDSRREIERSLSCIGSIYESGKDYESAVGYYRKQAESGRMLIKLGESEYAENLAAALLSEASSLENLGMWDEANERFEEALESISVRSPGADNFMFPDARLRVLAQFVTFHVRRGTPGESHGFFDEILAIYPQVIEKSNPYSLQLIGMCICGKAEMLSAREDFTRAAEMNRMVLNAYLRIPSYTKNTRLYRDIGNTYYNLGICLANRGETGDAVAQIEKSREIYLELFAQGEHSMLADAAGAHDICSALLRDEREYAKALEHLGHSVEYYTSMLDSGEERFRKNLLKAYGNIALIQQETGRLEESLETNVLIGRLSQELPLDPEDDRTGTLIAIAMRNTWICKKLGETRKAIDYSDETLSLLETMERPGREFLTMAVEAWMLRGFVYCDARRFEDGARSYGAALEILNGFGEPDFEIFHNKAASMMSVAVCRLYAGEIETALELLDALGGLIGRLAEDNPMEVRGTLGMFHTNRADALVRLGRYSEAIEEADKAIGFYRTVELEKKNNHAIGIDLAEVFLYRARALQGNGNLEAARTQFDEALANLESFRAAGLEYLAPKSAKVMLYRAKLLLNIGEKEAAMNDFREAARIFKARIDAGQEQWSDLLADTFESINLLN